MTVDAPTNPRRRRVVERDLAGLAASVFKPRRPRLALARAAVEGLDDPLEAWECLATRGVIPDAWLASPQRSIAGVAVHRGAAVYGGGFPDPARRPLAQASATPTTMAQCLAMASDPEGVQAAEALALEIAARLAPWGTPPVTRVVWWVDEATHADPATSWMPPVRMQLQFIVDCVRSRAYERSKRDLRPPSSPSAWRLPSPVREDADASLWWSRACNTGLVVPARATRHGRVADSIAGRPFASLPDPFEPLLALWYSGYGLERFEGDAAVLAAPFVDRPAAAPA